MLKPLVALVVFPALVASLGLFWEEALLCKGKRLPVVQIVNRHVQRELKRNRAPGHRMLWNVTVARVQSPVMLRMQEAECQFPAFSVREQTLSLGGVRPRWEHEAIGSSLPERLWRNEGWKCR